MLIISYSEFYRYLHPSLYNGEGISTLETRQQSQRKTREMGDARYREQMEGVKEVEERDEENSRDSTEEVGRNRDSISRTVAAGNESPSKSVGGGTSSVPSTSSKVHALNSSKGQKVPDGFETKDTATTGTQNSNTDVSSTGIDELF